MPRVKKATLIESYEECCYFYAALTRDLVMLIPTYETVLRKARRAFYTFEDSGKGKLSFTFGFPIETKKELRRKFFEDLPDFVFLPKNLMLDIENPANIGRIFNLLKEMACKRKGKL